MGKKLTVFGYENFVSEISYAPDWLLFVALYVWLLPASYLFF